ncbi:MAG TPA: PhnD/SsuA/transferrin family substrate-binding protein [Casimicrobiaceae bacterium]|nr:PhnD/SsuA/transferrin family substrate-binding protein [Casimicrobiaceae bacterium]
MIRSLLTAIIAVWLALAAPSAAAADLVFAITEGITYYQTNKEIAARFQPLTELLARALKRPVHTVVVSAYDDLRAGLARQEYDLAFVHPAHVALAAIKAGKYKSVAWTTGYTDYAVSLLMNKDQSFTRLEDLRGRTIVSPDPDSITAAMLRAMLRDQKLGAADVKIVTTRYQDAVPFYVEYGFAHAGATAAKAVVQSWTQKGGKVLLSSRPVPIKQMIASTMLSADDEQQIHAVLLGLAQSDAGRSALTVLGYKGFAEPSREDEEKAIAWLGL